MVKYVFDPVHSTLDFSIKHLMVSKVKGSFEKYDVDVTGDFNDLSTVEATVTIDVDSIDTGNKDRDNHLKSADFFNSEENKQIVFKTKKVTEDSVTGDLTIAGQTHEETFDFEFNGVSINPMSGGKVTGFSVSGKINREKYGVDFNQKLETGGVLIGKDVKFEADGEFAIEE